MNSDTKSTLIPTLTADILSQSRVNIDNLFSRMWQVLCLKSLLHRAGFKKRSGTPINDIVYLLMLWVWLKKDSVAMFCRVSLMTFSQCHKDALYDVLNREDLNWRKLQLLMAGKVIRETDTSNVRAFVVDDSVKTRRGKKMPGVSSHFDHLTGRCVMGQQILTLGLATETQFVPLDNELFISKTKVQPLNTEFKEGRSIVARRYKQSLTQTKPQMVTDMVKRALREGIEADYFLADAWFGTKPIISMCFDNDLVSVLRMKKNKMKYRLPGTGQLFTADALFREHIKSNWRRIKGQPYQSCSVVVDLNLAASDKETARWVKVKLLFVRGTTDDKPTPSKHDRALFLCTDVSLSDERVLAIYALRWGIEVYYKEAKQPPGLMKEQSRHYGTYIASMHLTSLRFCLLLFAKHTEQDSRLSDARNRMVVNMCTLDFASQLWGVFRALIAGALDQLSALLGEKVHEVLAHIDRTVTDYFVKVMQLDAFTLRLEARSDSRYRC